jgi:hypothetical protein
VNKEVLFPQFLAAKIDMVLVLLIAALLICVLYLNLYLFRLNNEAMRDPRNERARNEGTRFVVQKRAWQLNSEKLHSFDPSAILALVLFILWPFLCKMLIFKLATK